MRNKLKNLSSLLSLLAILFFASGSYTESVASSQMYPDYTGKWDISFYDASGKLQGGGTIVVNEDGSISEKVNLNLDNTFYLTEVSGSVSADGKIKEGKLTDTVVLENEGALSGSFTQSEASGSWKNYYSKSGTWKAKRSVKQDK